MTEAVLQELVGGCKQNDAVSQKALFLSLYDSVERRVAIVYNKIFGPLRDAIINNWQFCASNPELNDKLLQNHLHQY